MSDPDQADTVPADSETTASVPGHSVSTEGSPATTPSSARRRWRGLPDTFWVRIAFVLAGVLTLRTALGILTHRPFTWLDLVSSVTCATFVSCRRYREIQVGYVCLSLSALGVLLPVAITVPTMDNWIVLTFVLIVAGVLAARYAVMSRRQRRRIPVWLLLPDGREIPLNTRPFRCPTCDRVHHAVFAPSEPLAVPTFVPQLRHERRQPVAIVAWLDVREGQSWLRVAPPDFHITAAAIDVCQAFVVGPDPRR